MTYNELFGILGVILTFIGFYPYIRGIIRGTIKPHLFSWIIWGSITLLVFFAQVYDGGGAGAWPTGVTGTITLIVIVIAYFKSPVIQSDKIDWFILTLALMGMPIWYITSDPLWAVVIVTVSEVLGFLPTLRKVYYHPFEESLLFFNIFTFRNIAAIIALENYSPTTMLFPVAATFTGLILIALIIYRRRVLDHLTG